MQGYEDIRSSPVAIGTVKLNNSTINVLTIESNTVAFLTELGMSCAPIQQSEIIGRVGNSGGSNNIPHTHVHCQKDDSTSGSPRPIPFHGDWVVDRNKIATANKYDASAHLWVLLEGEGIPEGYSAIYPTEDLPYSSPPNIRGEAIDPLYLIMPGGIYTSLVTEGLHPHVPKVSEISAIIRNMTSQEKKVVLNRAELMIKYGEIVKEAFKEIK